MLSTAWNYRTGEPVFAAYLGTSMAAPHVSGVAALVLATQPGLSNSELRARLEGTAVLDFKPSIGHGRVNAYLALTGAPARTRRVFLIDKAGVVAASTEVSPAGTYRFTNVPNGTFAVYAGEDANGDGVFGRAFRRWGAAGARASHYRSS